MTNVRPDEIAGGLGRQMSGYLEIGNSNSHGTRPFYYNRLDDPVDSDQKVVNKVLSS